MIKFIIETVTSERDSCGNCYHFAVITRTDNRQCFQADVDGESNARYYAREAGLECTELYNIQRVVPKRQFKWLSKNIGYRPIEDFIKFFKGEIAGSEG